MLIPDSVCFRDINSDTEFCYLTIDTVKYYLQQFDKELDIKTVKTFYNEKIVIFLRVGKDGDKFFVKSCCHAEMKKGVTYMVDIALSSDGDINETQCECAAGMGPNAHCKHVCTVLYAVNIFCSTKTVITEETCTQKLQTFHHCKKFVGSPLKAKQMNLPRADEFTNMDFDPRPANLRNNPGYSDFFRNHCLNFLGISKMPIFQLIPPANSYAVALDHDYLELTPQDSYLEAIFVSKITEDEIKNIEKQTCGQGKNPLWADERTKRLTSSNFGRICKATDRTNKNKLAKSMVTVTSVKAPSLTHGLKYEHVALSKYMSLSGNVVNNCGVVVSKDYPFLSSSPDGKIDSLQIVEVKCPYTAKDKLISSVTVPYLKMDTNSKYYLEEKHDYYYQIQGQLLCTGAQDCVFIVYTIADILYFKVSRNDDFINKMVSELQDFFENYFKKTLLEKRFYKSYTE
ncbi:uncharacterized protein LOC121379200 [Gigantopelta aegis]|uniref:uncharacterized protein LOC121379200 n=1 Tax=Gigantopelta aegis TaxID=1735272 RepID=UPI001B88DB96|nr:uncharacterized protein LOC121379200 [Gigantopelta aegis]